MRGVVRGGGRRAREHGRQIDDNPAAARASIEVRLDLRALFAAFSGLRSLI
jgi:hypothetical protein